MLVFATTSNASDLGKLGVLPVFPKKFPVPAVSNLQDLAKALETSQYISPSEAQAVARSVQRQTGSDRFGVGIKTVLDCVFEAKSGQEDSSQVVELLADLLVENMEIEDRQLEQERADQKEVEWA